MESGNKTAAELERDLRMKWTADGVPQSKQDAIINDLNFKASPRYLDRFFPANIPATSPEAV